MTSRPDSVWCPSPNFKAYAAARKITCVVIHATATKGLESPRDWLSHPASKVSAHYLIGLEGNILRMVDEKNVAYHAGESEWKGVKHVNAFSVGIELVNSNDGKMPYPEAQITACAAICVPVCKDYGVKLEDVVGHKDIAPGRKTDPAGFPWDDFKSRLRAGGVS